MGDVAMFGAASGGMTMRRFFGGLGLALVSLLGLLYAGLIFQGTAVQIGLSAGVIGDRGSFQVDHCSTTQWQTKKGRGSNTTCTGTARVRSDRWSLVMHDPAPGPGPDGRLALQCWGRDCEQPDLGLAFITLLLDCAGAALAAGSLRGLRRAIRMWFGPETFVITDSRWARRAKRAWFVYWVALAVVTAVSLVAMVVTLCTAP
jgi:hypothetical protein